MPPDRSAEIGRRRFAAYVHVPFCTVRCGYCDFNTYTPDQLGGARPAYLDSVLAEISLARRVLGPCDLPLTSLFVGGGTPPLAGADVLARIVRALGDDFGWAAAPELTVEANPDGLAPGDLDRLRAAGFRRISFGVQSAVPRVLATLDRTHDPAAIQAAVGGARAAGFEQVSVDLIYGTPGESPEDWRETVSAALALRPDHVSAYALVVEEGTALARRIRAGQLPAPDDDDQAEKYVMADEMLGAAGLRWYELSNWSTASSTRCRHNLGYWDGSHWWGFGPGAHSHVAGVRWWNVKHPTTYAERLAEDRSPAQAREVLDQETRRVERVMLEIRLREGLPLEVVDAHGRAAVTGLTASGLVRREGDRLVLTRRGRLLADSVVRTLLA